MHPAGGYGAMVSLNLIYGEHDDAPPAMH